MSLILCRFCAKYSTILQIFFNRKVNTNCDKISTMVSIFQNLKISDSDDLPKYICGECLSKLKMAYDFYIQCLESETKLRIIQLQQIKPKAKKIIKILPKEDDNSSFKCVECDTIFKTNLDLENHINRIHKPGEKSIPNNRSYKCFECDEHFETKREILLHIKSHPNELLCEYCYYYFTSKTNLEAHTKTNHADFLFLCNICSKKFASKHNLFKHYQRIHKLNKISIFCIECNTSFSDKAMVDTHMREHHQLVPVDDEADCTQTDDLEMNEEFLDEFFLNQDENSFQFNEFDLFDDDSKLKSDDFSRIDGNNTKEHNNNNSDRYKCPKCNFKCLTQFILKQHLAHEHDEFVLTCNNCGENFNRAVDMDIHMDNHFKENRLLENSDEIDYIPGFILKTDNNRITYECKECQRVFYKKANFYNHYCKSSSTSEKITSIKCTVCSMTFKSHMRMYVHRKRTHKKHTQLYDCRLCDKTFKTVDGLKYHLKVHNGIKAFSCIYCEKKFTANINLAAHIRIVHAEIKPNVCKLCDKTFATIDHLKKHVTSVHQHERNHLCSVCGKGFAQLSHLKKHNNIHLDNRRYQCEHCDLRYIKKSDLKDHLNKVHKIFVV